MPRTQEANSPKEEKMIGEEGEEDVAGAGDEGSSMELQRPETPRPAPGDDYRGRRQNAGGLFNVFSKRVIQFRTGMGPWPTWQRVIPMISRS